MLQDQRATLWKLLTCKTVSTFGTIRMTDTTSDAIEVAKRYLEANLEARVSLDQLATEVGLSRFHFAHKFKYETGLTPLQYHLTKRIEKATELLRAGKTVVEVAQLLGFSDDSHLSRHFKRITGRTPGSVERETDS